MNIHHWRTVTNRPAEIVDGDGRIIATTQYQDNPVTAQDIRNAHFICATVNAFLDGVAARELEWEAKKTNHTGGKDAHISR